MRTISEIYTGYDIMPGLIEHQLRVAGVASIICHSHPTIDSYQQQTIVSACLLHDMGNIIKFDLDNIPTGAEVDNVDHWKLVQQRFWDQYGRDEHGGTIAIAQEIGVGDDVITHMESISTRRGPEVLARGIVSQMICAYSDLRVDPTGTVSLVKRFNDLQIRYQSHPTKRYGPEQMAPFVEMEKIIFAEANIEPSEIVSENVNETLAQLRSLVLV